MDQDLEALRRRAYSREGTDEDRRRLAEAQRPAPARVAVAEPVAAPKPVAAADPPPAADPAPEPTAARPRRRRPWPIVVAAAVGLGIGAAVGILAAPSPTPELGYPWDESLRVFDRPAETPPSGVALPADPALDETQAEVRYLGEADVGHVFASRATLRDGSGYICLHVVQGDITGAACGPESEFRRSGISLYTGDSGVRWSPVGNVLSATSRLVG